MDPIDKASMQGVFPGAAIVIRRIVVIAVEGAALVELKRIGKQPKQQFARIALADEIIQGLQIDRFQETLIEGTRFLRRDVEVGADGSGVAGGGVAENDVTPGREARR